MSSATSKYFWGILDSFSGQGIGFIIGIFLANLLAPELFGVYASLYAIFAVLNAIVDFGLSAALLRKKEVNSREYNSIWVFQIALSVVFAILAISRYYLYLFSYLKDYSEYMSLLSCVVVLNAFSIVPRVILEKNLRFKSLTLVSFISALLGNTAGLILAFNGFGLLALVSVLVIQSLIKLILLFAYSGFRPRFDFDVNAFRELNRYGSRLFLSMLSTQLFNSAVILVFGNSYSMVQAGFYSKANEIRNLPSQNLNAAMRKVSLPLLVSRASSKEQLRKEYFKLLPKVFFIGSCLLSLLWINLSAAVPLFYGPEWLSTVPIAYGLILASIFYPLNTLSLIIVQVLGEPNFYLRIELLKRSIGLGVILIASQLNVFLFIGGLILVSLIATLINQIACNKLLNCSFREVSKMLFSSSFMLLLAVTVSSIIGSIIFANELSMMLGNTVSFFLIVIFIGEVTRNPDYLYFKKLILNLRL